MLSVLVDALPALAELAAPSPTPLPYDPDDVTPGVVGFLFTFVIFLLVGAIAWDLLRRVRNMRYREEVRAKLEAEVAAKASSAGSPDRAAAGGAAAGGAAADGADAAPDPDEPGADRG